MRKIKKGYLAALACSILLSGLGITLIQGQAETTDNYAVTITSSMQGKTISLLNEELTDFALDYTKSSAINYLPADGVATDRYIPKPATISWENARDDALYYTLRVGLSQDLSDADSYVITETTADIDYLYAAKRYYYQVYAHYQGDEVVKSRVFDFYTADLPRTVYIEGVTNTRDIGGRYVQGGQYQIKQGMVYRGAEVNRELGAITEEGRRVMLHELGIKTDLDIRGGDVQNVTGTSPIHSSLNYIHLEAPWYTHITNTKYQAALAAEIRAFANPDNYPIYFHCSVGRDRAGTLSMILGALLGVQEDDLYRDYEMTFFSRVGLKDAVQSKGQHAELMGSFKATIDYITSTYPADTLMDSAERFAIEYLGITQAEVDTIRNTLWEEVGVNAAEAQRSYAPMRSTKKNAAKSTETRDFPCVYSAVAKGEAGAQYGSSAVNKYTASEAAAKGIPAGFENEVLEVLPLSTNSLGSCGVLLDFSAENIALEQITELQFRVYLGVSASNTGNYPQIRICSPDGSGEWIYQVNKATPVGAWTTVTIPYNSRFSYLCQNGILDKFELSLRTNTAIDFYVDSVTCVVKEVQPQPDPTPTQPPEVFFNFSEVKAVAGTKPMLKGLSLSNNEYVTWSNGALDNRYRLTAGTHTLTVTTADQTTQTITFIVTENEPVYTSVIDEAAIYGNVTVTFDGQNAITMPYGLKLNKPSDPVREATVAAKYEFLGWYDGDRLWDFDTDIVTADLALVSKWNEIPKTYNVWFEGAGISKRVEYGSLIPENFIPEAPEKEATSKKEYTFAGWYFGDTLWDFETDVVTGNVTLVAKYTESARLYTVTFDGENAQEYEYGAKIIEPETPVKESTDTVRYEFIGWYFGNKEWDFETRTVNFNINLQSKWNEIPLEEEAESVSSEEDESVDSDSSMQQDSDTTQSSASGSAMGCGGVIGGAVSGVAALGLAMVMLFKKKED